MRALEDQGRRRRAARGAGTSDSHPEPPRLALAAHFGGAVGGEWAGAEDRDELDGDDGRVRGAPARVGEGVLLPQEGERACGRRWSGEREGRKEKREHGGASVRGREKGRQGGEADGPLLELTVRGCGNDCQMNEPSRIKWMRVSNASQTKV